MMILSKRTMIGLFLCTLVFSSSIPMLLGIQATPSDVFGGDIMTLSQVNSTTSLTSDLAQELNLDENVIASPEIYAFCMIMEHPVVTRGVVIDKYLELEEGEIIEGTVPTNEFVVLGKALARRTGLGVGDKFVFTGSARPSIYQLQVDAIYTSPNSADDLLISLGEARHLAGLAPDAVSAIRVKTTNQTALIEELEEKDEPIIISDGGGGNTVVNTNITEEEKTQLTLAFKYEPEQFKSEGGSYVSVFIQEGGDSIKIVIITFIILDGALTFIGATAILARAIIERRPDIGTLSAIGADKNHIRKLIAKDIILISIPSSIAGVVMGSLIVVGIDSYSLMQMFGQTIHPMIDSTIMLEIFLATAILFIISGILVNETLMGTSPQNMMRDSDDIADDKSMPELTDLLDEPEIKGSGIA